MAQLQQEKYTALPLAREIYGLLTGSQEAWLNYGYALLAIAGADDEVSTPEMNWLLVDFASMIRLPEEVKQAFRSFDYRTAKLDSLLANISFDSEEDFRRVLIYDAIKMSRADGVYDHRERNAVLQTAEILDVDAGIVVALEGTIAMEESLLQVRKDSIFAAYDKHSPSKGFITTKPIHSSNDWAQRNNSQFFVTLQLCSHDYRWW
jgi:uncharacterized tellurite resistance protein B-like protein